MVTAYQTELHIPRQLVSIAAVQKFFEVICLALSIPNETQMHVELAIEEGISILFKHAMNSDEGNFLRVKLVFFEDSIKVEIMAPGRPFDFEKLPQYDPQKLLIQEEVHGLSGYLLQNVVDRLEWRYVEKEGLQLTLIKNLPITIHSVGESGLSLSDEQLVNACASGVQLAEITCRRVQNYDDAVALAACAYDIYRYAYKDVIYYPRELLIRNEAGMMRSYIAVDKGGNIYGHYAVIKQNLDDKIAEVGAAFVRPECRKGGVFASLAEQLHHDARQMGLNGIYSLSVTDHISTQKTSEHFGRKTVGIRVGSSPAVFVEGARPGDRTTTTLNYCPFLERTLRYIFVPERYRMIVLNSYRHLALAVHEKAVGDYMPMSSGREDSNPVKDQNFFDWYRDMAWNRAIIRARGGSMVCQKLQALTEILVESGIVCIVLSIDIEDASAPALAETAVRCGYFYSGIFPESFADGCDALQMQFLNGVKINRGKIMLYQESAKEIMTFIQQEVPQIFQEKI